MPPVSVPAIAAQQIPHLAILIMAAVVAGALVRVVLCILAAFAVRKALSDTSEDAVAIKAHHLAVLQIILGTLTRQAQQKPPSDDQPVRKHVAACAFERGPCLRLGRSMDVTVPSFQTNMTTTSPERHRAGRVAPETDGIGPAGTAARLSVETEQ